MNAKGFDQNQNVSKYMRVADVRGVGKEKKCVDVQIAKDRFNDPDFKVISGKELRRRLGVKSRIDL